MKIIPEVQANKKLRMWSGAFQFFNLSSFYNAEFIMNIS